MKAFALALGVSEDVFASRVDQSFWQLRMAAYPGVSGEVDSSKSGLYQHSDFGILTFLLTDEHKGSLKVLAPNGEDWMSADPIPVRLSTFFISTEDASSSFLAFSPSTHVLTDHRALSSATSATCFLSGPTASTNQPNTKSFTQAKICASQSLSSLIQTGTPGLSPCWAMQTQSQRPRV